MITVVSGLPRCGTSMMMQMLEAGGMPVLTDGVRVADRDNPRGYYEFEKVKQIEQDDAWLSDADGRAVKMVSKLLYQLPERLRYKIVFMTREMSETLASQSVMLENMGVAAGGPTDTEMERFFRGHLADLKEWLGEQRNMDVMYCSYNEFLREPGACVEALETFLGQSLDLDRMVGVIDPDLYRQRNAGAST